MGSLGRTTFLVTKNNGFGNIKAHYKDGLFNFFNRDKIMKSELQVFNFENVEIRTIMLEDGIWFVAKDVSNVLGYSQLGHALRLVDDDDKLLITNKNPLSGLEIPDRGIYLINESGLYSMILNSRREC